MVSRLLPGFGLVVLVALGAQPGSAASLTAHLSDQKGNPVEMGVLVATPTSSAPAPAPREAIMDQIDEAFVPHVLPVVVGTRISFPNRDDIRHHVYSFSDAKNFELPLYKGTPADPVVFDQPGDVVLGCNIHDHMRGYVYVVESPYFATSSEAGVVELAELPDGEYEIRAWHPRLKRAVEPLTVQIAAGATELDFELQLKPALRLRGSRAGGKKY